MAEANFMGHLPSVLMERFLPQEKPAFKVLRRRGAVVLWRSQTQAHERHGYACRKKVHYHITIGDEPDYVLLPRFQTAMVYFEDACCGQGDAHACQ